MLPARPKSTRPRPRSLLAGPGRFRSGLALQQRLVEQAHQRDDGQITLLLCEHPAIITIGRGGSPGDVAMQSGLVRNRQIEVRWVNRGGGCLVHCPGQLAIYPIVPLRWHGFSVGEFLDRFQAGIIETLDDLNVPTRGLARFAAKGLSTPPRNGRPHRCDRWGVWGRTGQLAALGVAVRHWVTYYGGLPERCPPMGLFRLVETDPVGHTPMSCLVAERCGPVRMTAVRAALVRRLAERFGCDRYHLYTGHPMLPWGSGIRS